MVDGDVEGLAAIGRGHTEGQRGLGLELVQANDGNPIAAGDAVVVSGVGESEGKHALLLQVGLVDTSE